MAFILLSLGLLLDQLLGEAKRFHPLVGFGHAANRIENCLNSTPDSNTSIIRGGLAMLVLILPLCLIVSFLTSKLNQYNWLLSVIVIYWAIGFKSLIEHSEQVANALYQNDHEAARHSISLMVSRDTSMMDTPQITSATIESTLENGCDSSFAVLFWFMIGGAPFVVLYRLTNTLDAMWGYRNQRFEMFGKSAARLDDLLNYIPARLTAWSYALCGDTSKAIKSWRAHASLLASPNGGPVMAAGAGSLNIELGGPASYHGKRLSKAYFGGANKPNSSDISRANGLVTRALLLWCCIILLLSLCRFLISVLL